MAILRTLDEEHLTKVSHDKPVHHALAPRSEERNTADADRPNPNVNTGFSAILSCYP